MKQLLKSPLIITISGGLSFLVSLALLLMFLPAMDMGEPNASHPTEPMIWNPQNPEIDQMIKELQKEREEVQRQKAELQKTAEQLQSERGELDQAAARVSELQAQFDANVVQVKTDEAANLKKQAKMYASMAPEAAAQILHDMDEKSVVKVLACMKEDESALLLEAFVKKGSASSRKASLLAEQLRKVLVQKTEKKPNGS